MSEVNAVPKQWGYVTKLARGVLPCSEVKKSEGENVSLFWCTQSNTRPSQIAGKGEELQIQKNPDPYYSKNQACFKKSDNCYSFLPRSNRILQN